MSKRFRVAFSFAGEKRDFVAEVAGMLAKRFGKDHILYDKYHEAEFARSDLAFHLPALYHDEADLVVAVLCNEYDKKEWCGLEWSAIYGRIKNRQVDEVMLSRFDRVEGEGLYGLAGFIELDLKTTAEVATLILERLALNESKDKDYYTRDTPAGPGWPDVAPPLDWPLADHTEARRAFAQLITRDAPFRILPIRGVSGTGKSLLTNQFIGNAPKIAGLASGRFDFKGSSDLSNELGIFSRRLKVSVPAPGAVVSDQLAHILDSLGKRASPTLLVFDTFEAAGKAETWVTEELLLAVMDAPWLRVIITGQRVPARQGTPWAGRSSKLIELRAPTPEEWFEYSRKHQPDVTLEFLSELHKLARGNISTLAQVCGPES